jgi:hypothetical protein
MCQNQELTRSKPSTLKAVFVFANCQRRGARKVAREKFTTPAAFPSGGQAVGGVLPAQRQTSFPAPIFSNCAVAKAGGGTGARRAERIYAAQYLMALSSEHGGAEGVAARGGTGAQGAPNFFNRS